MGIRVLAPGQRRSVSARPEAGFSLIEALVAIAVLAGVLLSIASLLYMASRYVGAGRKQTKAVSTARDVLEEFRELGFHQTYTLLSLDETSNDEVYVATVADLASGGTGVVEVDLWLADLKEAMGNGSVRIRFRSIVESGTPPALEDASAILIDVTVLWQEAVRDREVHLCSLRT